MLYSYIYLLPIETNEIESQDTAVLGLCVGGPLALLGVTTLPTTAGLLLPAENKHGEFSHWGGGRSGKRTLRLIHVSPSVVDPL